MKLLSICIPTYNRPQELKRLLESIDTTRYDDVNIVICENCSPKQAETRAVVENFKAQGKYDVYYYENGRNIGYDKNIRALLQHSEGVFSMFFSDDDLFIPGALDNFVEFVRAHQDCGYILRSYRNMNSDGTYQDFRYYKEDREFPAGMETAIEMYDKSCFLSGYTIRTEYAREYVTEQLDGYLLYQMYLLLEVCKRYPAAYSRILISLALPENIHYFGESEEEKDLFKGHDMDGDNNLNLVLGDYKVINYFSEKYKDDTAKRIGRNMAKLSYPSLAVERRKKRGLKSFIKYSNELRKIGYGQSVYFYIYFIALVLFGAGFCDSVIEFIKKKLGHRPKL